MQKHELKRTKMKPKGRIMVIGAGLAGSRVAKGLVRRGFSVVVADKGRGAGGRLSTRRFSHGYINHGAPEFRWSLGALHDLFQDWVEACVLDLSAFEGEKIIRPSGKMNELIKVAQRGINVEYGRRIVALESSAQLILTEDASGKNEAFDYVVLAIPAPQAMALLPPDNALHGVYDDISYQPQWVVLLSSDGDHRFHEHGHLIERVVETDGGVAIHLTATASLRFVEYEPAQILQCFGLTPESAKYVGAHRWRYSQVRSFSEESYGEDAMGRIFACGDGFGGVGVEGAVSSADALLARLERLS